MDKVKKLSEVDDQGACTVVGHQSQPPTSARPLDASLQKAFPHRPG